MEEKAKTVQLYRIENPNIPANPDGITSHEDLVGQWFTPNIGKAMNYLRKSTRTPGSRLTVDGAQLVVAKVPADILDKYHADEHPVARLMDVEPDNYILPLDGSVPMDTIPLDPTIGDLRDLLSRPAEFREAKDRIQTLVGQVAVEK